MFLFVFLNKKLRCGGVRCCAVEEVRGGEGKGRKRRGEGREGKGLFGVGVEGGMDGMAGDWKRGGREGGMWVGGVGWRL